MIHYSSGIFGDVAGMVYGVNSIKGGFTALVGQCFVEGTIVKTKEGDKNIEDIEEGDEVYSYNPETGEEGYKTVNQTFIKETNDLVHLTATSEDGEKSVTLDTTLTHPFYVVGYGFKYASELKIGDKLRSVSGDIYEVSATETEHFVNPVKVYNFEVDEWHTYAVSEEGIVVHNSSSCVKSTTESDNKKNTNKHGEVVNNKKYSNWDDLKSDNKGHIKSYIKSNKPKGSPDVKKWFKSGGTIEISSFEDGTEKWKYITSDGLYAEYIDGKIEFAEEFMFKDKRIADFYLESFTGDRNKDKAAALEFLKKNKYYDIPDGYVLHHAVESGHFQLVDARIHALFTHYGGNYYYKINSMLGDN